MGLSAQIRFAEPVCFSGGVAMNVGVVKAIEKELGKPLIVLEKQQITAAIGAVFFAKKNAA